MCAIVESSGIDTSSIKTVIELLNKIVASAEEKLRADDIQIILTLLKM